MWTSGRCLTIPITQAGVSAGLWLIAAVLMLMESVTGADGRFARWAIFVALGAVTVTVAVIANHTRRVVLDVISWEAQRTRDAHLSADLALRLVPTH